MIRSMTGFGMAEQIIQNTAYRVEIKTLNSKSFDPSVRLPVEFREREADVRQMLLQRFQRGKIEFHLICPNEKNPDLPQIHQPLLVKYFNELKNIQRELGITVDESMLFINLLKFPGVLVYGPDQILDDHWPEIVNLIEEAIEKCDQSRITEGKKIEEDLTRRLQLIKEYLQKIEPFENERIEKIKERIRKELLNIITAEQLIDTNRFEQELIYYLEKLDITEEKVRLESHCAFFLETIYQEDAQGRKLVFLAQEMGREINTLGAKANHHQIQHLVVLMKDELEKIKEQLYNVL